VGAGLSTSILIPAVELSLLVPVGGGSPVPGFPDPTPAEEMMLLETYTILPLTEEL